MKAFAEDFPDLSAMIKSFEYHNRNGERVFSRYYTLNTESVNILDKFLYMWYLGRIKHEQTYNIDEFKNLVMSEYEKQQKSIMQQQQQEKKTKELRNEKLHNNVEQILTKVNELDTKINLMQSSAESVGGSKKKRKYRTKKR